MNLETLERECLNYLRDVSSPLVPVTALLRRLRQDEALAGVDEKELLDFLRNHDEVRVIEEDPEREAELAEASIPPGPRVMLKVRVPTTAEMARAVGDQITRLAESLQSALAEAERDGDAAKAKKVREMLARTEELQQRFKDAFRG
ncbi:MAG: hypothetical protein GWP08_20345 [Nitrospiraceae bacterium]|nr:hypothetical protein [Nitrospiraceae bacterium]